MKYLAELRKMRKMTQSELSQSSGIAINTILRYERGYLSPSLENAKKLALGLGSTVEELTSGSSKSRRELKLILDKAQNRR